MDFDLSNDLDILRFKRRAKFLIEKKDKISLTKLNNKRTIPQNAYLHVCITLFAIQSGYTIDEAKQYLKSECSFMHYIKNGFILYKQTSKCTKDELNEFIEWIRNYSVQNLGCYIPSADEYKFNRVSIDNEIKANKQYL